MKKVRHELESKWGGSLQFPLSTLKTILANDGRRQLSIDFPSLCMEKHSENKFYSDWRFGECHLEITNHPYQMLFALNKSDLLTQIQPFENFPLHRLHYDNSIYTYRAKCYQPVPDADKTALLKYIFGRKYHLMIHRILQYYNNLNVSCTSFPLVLMDLVQKRTFLSAMHHRVRVVHLDRNLKLRCKAIPAFRQILNKLLRLWNNLIACYCISISYNGLLAYTQYNSSKNILCMFRLYKQ